MQILRSGSGRFRCRRYWRRRFQCRYLGEVSEGSGTEGSGADTEVRFRRFRCRSGGEVPEGSGLEGSGTDDTE